MNIEAKQPSVKGPAQTFSGDVWFDVVAPEGDYPRMRVNVVRFAPGARTAWHCHPGEHVSDAEYRATVEG